MLHHEELVVSLDSINQEIDGLILLTGNTFDN